MRVQTAIDRVSLEEAVDLAKRFDGKTDILEMGTSLVKDYGNHAIEALKAVLPNTTLLVDSKTIDEGAYEFRQAIRYGGEIITAMGAASVDTLTACYEVAEQAGKTMMIDLLEVSDEKVEQIKHFDHAIYALHHSIDRKDKIDVAAHVAAFHAKFPEIKHLAVAGGIKLPQAEELAQQGIIEVIIVGSTITKSDEPLETLNAFMEGINK